jgi:ABC-type multidrug transport system fused ATPase/permease subunit
MLSKSPVMKNYLLLALSVLILGSCSSPKYAYHFNYHDYTSGKKKDTAINEIIPASGVASTDEFSAQFVDQTTMVASAKAETFYPAESELSITHTKEVVLEKFKAMSKEEKKEFKTRLKTYIKESKKSEVTTAQAKAGLEQDVKLAAIFGAVGIVLLIIGGNVLSIIGAVALLIGLYFFVRWLVHQ